MGIGRTFRGLLSFLGVNPRRSDEPDRDAPASSRPQSPSTTDHSSQAPAAPIGMPRAAMDKTSAGRDVNQIINQDFTLPPPTSPP